MSSGTEAASRRQPRESIRPALMRPEVWPSAWRIGRDRFREGHSIQRIARSLRRPLFAQQSRQRGHRGYGPDDPQLHAGGAFLRGAGGGLEGGDEVLFLVGAGAEGGQREQTGEQKWVAEKAETRNPKTEGRPRSEIRSSKAAVLDCGSFRSCGWQAAALQVTSAPTCGRMGGGFGLRTSDFLRVSGFGLRIWRLGFAGNVEVALLIMGQLDSRVYCLRAATAAGGCRRGADWPVRRQ